MRSLGDLVGALNGRLPTAGWHEHLKNMLSDPLLNPRNVIAHGLRAEVGREDAALLIHAARSLRLLAPAPASPA